jgi:hypothetical protein
MGKSKTKTSKNTSKKSAPLSGMVVKNAKGNTHAKSSSMIPNKNFSSAKKGGIVTTPRKAK